MARLKISKKEDRKDNLDPTKDEFVMRSMSFLDWAVERRRQIGVLLGLGLAAWIGVIVFNHVRDTHSEKVSGLLAEGLDASFAPVITASWEEAGLSAPQDEKSALTFGTRDARARETIKRFDRVIAEAGNSPLASVSSFIKAGALMDQGRAKDAVALYEACLKDDALSFMADSIRMALAVALEAAGRGDEAIRQYEMLSAGSGRTALWARFNAVRLRMDAGKDTAGAEKSLTEIVKSIASAGEPDRNDYLFVQARARLLAINPDADVPELPSGLNPQILQQLLSARQGALQ